MVFQIEPNKMFHSQASALGDPLPDTYSNMYVSCKESIVVYVHIFQCFKAGTSGLIIGMV